MINKALNHLEELLVTFLMGAATLIIFASVVHRYAAGVTIPVSYTQLDVYKRQVQG